MLALGAYQVDATSERTRDGQARARSEERRIGRPPALSPEQVEQCRRMAQEGTGLRHIARVMQCSPATVKKTLSSRAVCVQKVFRLHLPGSEHQAVVDQSTLDQGAEIIEHCFHRGRGAVKAEPIHSSTRDIPCRVGAG